MTATTLMALARHDLRRRWKEVTATALLVAVGVAGVMITANVARRTDTAFDRLTAAAGAWDVLVNPDLGTGSKLDPTTVQRLPEVQQSGVVSGIMAVPAGITDPSQMGQLQTMVVTDGAVGYGFGRPNLLEGHMPSPDAPDDIFVDRGVAIALGLHVGDTLPIQVPSTAVIDEMKNGTDISGVLAQVQSSPRVDLRVVGIGVTADDFAFGPGEASDIVFLTPAFAATHLDGDAMAHSNFFGVAVRLKPGADLTAFRQEVQQLVPGESVAFQTLPAIAAQAHRSSRPYSVALAASALVVALLVALVTALSVSRLVLADRRERSTWWALGAVRSQRFAVLMLRALVAVVVGIAVGLLATVAFAGLKGIGPARLADPNHGVYLDGLVVGIGAAVAFVVFAALAAAVAWRGSAIPSEHSALRPSTVGNWLAATSFPPAAVVGVRHALEQGEGRNRVPSRAVLVGATAAVLVATAAVTFGAGMQQLTNSPHLYGWNWDRLLRASEAVPEEQLPDLRNAVGPWIGGSDDVRGAAMVWVSDATVGSRSVVTAAFDPMKGTLVPTMATGRAPEEDDEIALGRLTMHDLGARVGGTVQAMGHDGPIALKVTGVAVLPTIANYTGADKTALGEGAVVTKATLDRLGGQFSPIGVAVDLNPDHRIEHLLSTAPDIGVPNPIVADAAERPADVANIARVRSAPVVLAALTGVIALVTVGEALFGAVRRRRRDLAVVRALGFTTRQTAACVLWQSAAIALIASLIGIPLGAATGRWWWHELTGYLGGIDSLSLPVGALFLTALVTLMVCLLLAAVPARNSARARPSAVLRTE
jgi:ABC-type antimicrobial peptide transport system permease subunit